MVSILRDWSYLFFLVLVVSLQRCSHAQSGTSSTLPLGLSLRDNLKASFSVMIVAFLSAFVFMGFFSLYLRHCANTYVYSRNPIAAAAAADIFRGRLHREVINKCPILVYSAVKDLKIGKLALECAVCLGEFQGKDKIRLLPKCHHVFHPDCIDAWFISHLTCPVCRATLTSSDCADNAVVVPTASNLDESHAASEEIEQQSTSESREPPAQTIRVDESGSSGLLTVLTQTTPPIQSRMTGRFPRSHSTGHSLVMEPEGTMDRYTLRLPEHVKERILTNQSRIRRSASSDVVLQGSSSSKSGSDSMEKWVLFSMIPPFISRYWSSVQSPEQNTETSSCRPPV